MYCGRSSTVHYKNFQSDSWTRSLPYNPAQKQQSLRTVEGQRQPRRPDKIQTDLYIAMGKQDYSESSSCSTFSFEHTDPRPSTCLSDRQMYGVRSTRPSCNTPNPSLYALCRLQRVLRSRIASAYVTSYFARITPSINNHSFHGGQQCNDLHILT